MIDLIKKDIQIMYDNSKELFRHGLTISTKPKNGIEFTKGDCIIKGISTYQKGDELNDLFSKEWFLEDDKISLGIFLNSQNHFLRINKENMIYENEESIQSTENDIQITSNGTHSIFCDITTDCNISIQSTGSLRIHLKVSNGAKVQVFQTVLDEGIVHKVAHITGGTVTWNEFLTTKSYIRSYTINKLLSKDSEGFIQSFYLTKEQGMCDVYTENSHLHSRTFSNIITKGVLLDKSKALSRGLVLIGENAANSEGYEQQDALLLSSKAEADAIPNLVIHNHDVKCSHGSTIGKIEEEKIFYLTSRGISLENAEKLLAEGYFQPVIDSIKNEKLKKKVEEVIQKSIYS